MEPWLLTGDSLSEPKEECASQKKELRDNPCVGVARHYETKWVGFTVHNKEKNERVAQGAGSWLSWACSWFSRSHLARVPFQDE